MKSTKKIKDIVLLSILILIGVVFSYFNFKSGTFLSGWDTIHSEFDFGIAFKRLTSPTFQEFQGIGAVSAQSHIAELPRIVFLFIFSFIFELNFLRYFYVFLMLILGPLGVYQFLKVLLNRDPEDEENDSYLYPAFIGALFYLTNLSVVQHFSVPLEMFITFYGFLGFLFLYITKSLKDFNQKNILNLALFSFLIAPSAHTATLFYMLLLFISFFFLIEVIFSEKDQRYEEFKKRLVIFLTILITNLFWILPNIYFILTHGAEVSQSKIHILFSDQAYLSNLSFGNFLDLAILKNYLFIWQVWNGRDFAPLLNEWARNLDAGLVIHGYLVFFAALFGVGLTLVQKDKRLYGFIGGLMLCLIFISSSRSVLGNFVDYLRDNIPFVREALRFPFNKFSTLLSLSIAVFLAVFFDNIFSVVKRNILKITTTFVFMVLSLAYFLPALSGQLISPYMRVSYPNAYFELFDYFKNQGEFGRVADFPIHSVYGWSYYNFGYQGAGFLWFGIDKPIFNREFDRWNTKNEDYYNEMSFAIYNNDPRLVESVLKKYQIRWILIDKNIFAPLENDQILHFGEIEKTLKGISSLKMEKKFGENIYVYKYFPQDDFVESKVLKNTPMVTNEFFRESRDLNFENFGNYYSEKSTEISYGLKGKTELLRKEYISSDEDSFYIKNVSGLKKNQGLIKAIGDDKGFEISFKDQKQRIDIKDKFDFLSLNDTFLYPKKEVDVLVSTENILDLLKIDSQNDATALADFISAGNCSEESAGAVYSLEKKDNNLVVNSKNTVGCINLDLRAFLGSKQFDNYYLTFKVSGLNANNYFCVLKDKECNKEKITGDFSILLTNKDTNLIIFNEPIEISKQATSTVTGLNLLTLKKSGFQNLAFTKDVFVEQDEIILKKSPIYTGNLARFGFSPSNCGESDILNSLTGVFNSSSKNICDSYEIGYDSKNYSVLEIKSRNTAGLPLRVCLQNIETKKCDLFMPLPKNKEFESDYILLPPFEGPHYLAVTNQVIEGNPSYNEISYMSVAKIPYSSIFSSQEQKRNPKDIYYLGTSFDKGFVAFCGITPCQFPHVLVNNWANGWILPEGQNPDEINLKVVFWPNFLPLVGFFALGMLILYTLKVLFRPIAIDK